MLSSCRRRQCLGLKAALAFLLLISILCLWPWFLYRQNYWNLNPPPTPVEPERPEPEPVSYHPPPAYSALRRYEQNLPQHNLHLDFPEGQTGRYVKFSNQIRYLGWNNCLNEMCVVFF